MMIGIEQATAVEPPKLSSAVENAQFVAAVAALSVLMPLVAWWFALWFSLCPAVWSDLHAAAHAGGDVAYYFNGGVVLLRLLSMLVVVGIVGQHGGHAESGYFRLAWWNIALMAGILAALAVATLATGRSLLPGLV